MTKGDFSARQQKAIEEMLKMNEQSQKQKPTDTARKKGTAKTATAAKRTFRRA